MKPLGHFLFFRIINILSICQFPTDFPLQITFYQRTIGPENAHLKPDLGVLSHHEMTLTLNTHTPLLTSQVVCICKVSGLRLQKFPNPVISEKTIISILISK